MVPEEEATAADRRREARRLLQPSRGANSGFGTVFGVADGKPLPVCDYAGFAPFGFGYRRCPGEQLTIEVFADFLRKVWHDKIAFRKLNLPNPGRVPIGPSAVITDDIGFTRRT
jgi:cytochrome P450